MPEYTMLAALSVTAVLVAERWWFRTGLLRERSWWIAMAICLAFMILVNGWLTKLSAPIVTYDPEAKTPWRFPWDIPVEDFLFGFALLTLVGVLWKRAGASLGRDAAESHAGHTVEGRP
jgi:lycopene cyclase domain-containing protein